MELIRLHKRTSLKILKNIEQNKRGKKMQREQHQKRTFLE